MTEALTAAIEALRAMLAQYGQHARLLRLTTPLGADRLLPERLAGRESLSEGGFRFELTVLATDAHLELKRLIGQPVLIEVLTQGSRTDLRPFHGHVTAFELLGGEGGFARYRLVVEPWLAFLRYRQDSYVFQDKSVVEIVEEVFRNYQGQGKLAPAWRFELADPGIYLKRSLAVQYEESDYAFVERLLAEEGLFYWFEHEAGAERSAAGDSAASGGGAEAQGAGSEAGQDRLGKHTLVIADHNGACQANAQARIAFKRADATETEDTVQRWRSLRQLQTNRIELASWDYRSLGTRPVSADAPGERPIELAAADYPGAYAYVDAGQGERYARRQLEALQAREHLFQGEGTVRTLAPGTTFVLTGHAEHDRLRREQGEEAARLLVTAVEHRARNNLASELRLGIDRLLGSGADNPATTAAASAAEPLYSNRFQAIPAGTPWRPMNEDGHGLRIHPRPTVHGLQTAIVVGLDAEPITTDRDHRVKIQFHWQRGARSHNRLAHPSGDDDAPGNERASPWVRVATPLAGANWGGVFVPRIGQEVLVAFVAGDIDRPVVVGALYNGRGQPDSQANQVGAGAGAASGNAPAWFPGGQGSHAHNAVISGIKTQALSHSRSGAGGYNQLVFDNTPNEGRATLATTEHATQLNLGHLKHQRDNERRANRGHGAELATQGYGALRAGAGLLLASDARPNGAGSQLDSREAQAQLTQTRELAQALADTAQKHHAKLPGEAAADKLAAVEQLDHSLVVLQASETGSGQAAATTSGSQAAGRAEGEGAGRSIGGGQGSAPAWSEPMLLASSPAGIAALTPGDIVMAAGNTLSLAAGQDLNFLAQSDQVWAVKDGVVLFTYGKAADANKPNRETGIKLHAASGQVSVQAHSDAIEAGADKTVTLASTAKTIQIAAPEHVLLTAQGASVRLTGGNIEIHAPGTVQFKASQKNLTGPRSVSVKAPTLPAPTAIPVEPSDQSFVRRYLLSDAEGYVLAHRPYRAWLANGQVIDGYTDADGLTQEIDTRQAELARIEFLKQDGEFA